MNSATMPDFSPLDLARMLVGVLSAAGGVAACLLFLVRIQRRDNLLLYFGLAAGSMVSGCSSTALRST
jgi:hypothetical protein